MNVLSQFNRYFSVLLVIILISVVSASFMVISKLLDQQYSSKQAALSPFFSLITDTIVRPIYLSKAMASNPLFIELLEAKETDIKKVYRYLNGIQSNFRAQAFVVSERDQLMYSNNKTYPPGTPEFDWYYDIKKNNSQIAAGIGNEDNLHFYVDVRMENDRGDLIGYTGVGVSLEAITYAFTHFHAQFQASFYFVNEKGEIILSSEPEVKTTDFLDTVYPASAYNWYKAFDPLAQHEQEDIVSQELELDGNDYMVSRISLTELNWNLYIITMPKVSRSQLLWEFIFDILLLLAVSISLISLLVFLFKYYHHAVLKIAFSDNLTGLANRARLEEEYNQLPDKNPLALLFLDIDHFKNLNDTYGHNFGDMVLEQLATQITPLFRTNDLICRWGGEEFVILLPGVSQEKALAIAERCRAYLAGMPVEFEQQELFISASFGVVFTKQKLPLSSLIDAADKALYQAKKSGRNQVILAQTPITLSVKTPAQ